MYLTSNILLGIQQHYVDSERDFLTSIWEKLHSVPDSTLSSVISSLNPDYISPIICHYQLFIPFNAKWKYIQFLQKELPS